MQVRLLRIVFVIAAVSATLWAADEPIVGTWKLNVAKSTFNGPAPKSRTLKLEPSGNGFKLTTDEIDAQGKRDSSTYTANFDGKDYAAKTPFRDTIAWKRIDARTWETTSKKDGKVTDTSRRVVSPDGKMLTITTTGTNAQGQKVSRVSVYDKQ